MATAKQRMLSGEPYRGGDPELTAERARCQAVLAQVNALPADRERRMALLRDLLGSVGDGADVEAPFRCDYGWNIALGEGTFVNYGCVILDCAPVTIGARVQIATNVQLLTADHPLEAGLRREGWESAAPIRVGDNAWLGGGVIVCPGVTIGENTVVGAGGVVTADLPPDVLAVGVPARVVRRLP